MSKASIDTVGSALRRSWTAETAYNPAEWTKSNPARGQCVVSALIVQDYLGGELQRFEVIGLNITETHYANILPDGTLLDTTSSQYLSDVRLTATGVNLKGHASLRAKRLADPDTRKRYLLLKKRVDSFLK